MELKRTLTLKMVVTMITISFTVVSVLVVAVIGYINLYQMFQGMVKDKCNDMVGMLAPYVDIPKLSESIAAFDADDPYLAELHKRLYDVKTNTNFEYVYLLRQKDNMVETIVDGSCDVSDPLYMKLGDLEPLEYYNSIEKVFASGERVVSDIYLYEGNGQSYSLISAYFPIKSSDGKLIAVLGGDISMNSNSSNMERLKKIVNHFIIALLLLMMGAAIATFITCTILFRPLSKIVKHIQTLSKGDFKIAYHYNKNNEIGRVNQSLNHLVAGLKKMFLSIMGCSSNLGEVVQILDNSTEQISISVQEVTAAMESILHSAEKQNEYVKTGIENMNYFEENIASSLTDLKSLSDTIGQVTICKDAGMKAIHVLRQQSALSSETLKKVEADIQNTNESVNLIGTVSDTIQNIASQTNLLALNASIEAARVGEAGKGFAVVAEEIRKLSEESNVSARKIMEIIGRLMKNSEHMMVTMTDMVKGMTEESEVVAQTEYSFEQISGTIDHTHDSLENLVVSSTGMEKAAKGLHDALALIMDISSGHASATEEVFHAVHEETLIINGITDKAKILTEQMHNLENAWQAFRF